MQKFIVELIGTFFLVLTVGACVDNPSPGVIAPIAIGGALMIMIFAGGHISGGHYNPAVPPGGGRAGPPGGSRGTVVYSGAIDRCGGRGRGRFFLKGENRSVITDTPLSHLGQIALAEFLFTFALAYVVLNVATAKATAGNSFYGLAIGSTVMAGAFAVGPISGGVFNPTVATGALYLGLLPPADYLGYVAAQLAAGVFAAFIFKVLHPDDK